MSNKQPATKHHRTDSDAEFTTPQIKPKKPPNAASLDADARADNVPKAMKLGGKTKAKLSKTTADLQANASTLPGKNGKALADKETAFIPQAAESVLSSKIAKKKDAGIPKTNAKTDGKRDREPEAKPKTEREVDEIAGRSKVGGKSKSTHMKSDASKAKTKNAEDPEPATTTSAAPKTQRSVTDGVASSVKTDMRAKPAKAEMVAKSQAVHEEASAQASTIKASFKKLNTKAARAKADSKAKGAGGEAKDIIPKAGGTEKPKDAASNASSASSKAEDAKAVGTAIEAGTAKAREVGGKMEKTSSKLNVDQKAKDFKDNTKTAKAKTANQTKSADNMVNEAFAKSKSLPSKSEADPSARRSASGAADEQPKADVGSKVNDPSKRVTEGKAKEASGKVTEGKAKEPSSKVTEGKTKGPSTKITEGKTKEPSTKVIEGKPKEPSSKVTEGKPKEPSSKVTEGKSKEASTKVTEGKAKEPSTKVIEGKPKEPSSKVTEGKAKEPSTKVIEGKPKEASTKVTEGKPKEPSTKVTEGKAKGKLNLKPAVGGPAKEGKEGPMMDKWSGKTSPDAKTVTPNRGDLTSPKKAKVSSQGGTKGGRDSKAKTDSTGSAAGGKAKPAKLVSSKVPFNPADELRGLSSSTKAFREKLQGARKTGRPDAKALVEDSKKTSGSSPPRGGKGDAKRLPRLMTAPVRRQLPPTVSDSDEAEDVSKATDWEKWTVNRSPNEFVRDALSTLYTPSRAIVVEIGISYLNLGISEERVPRVKMELDLTAIMNETPAVNPQPAVRKKSKQPPASPIHESKLGPTQSSIRDLLMREVAKRGETSTVPELSFEALLPPALSSPREATLSHSPKSPASRSISPKLLPSAPPSLAQTETQAKGFGVATSPRKKPNKTPLKLGGKRSGLGVSSSPSRSGPQKALKLVGTKQSMEPKQEKAALPRSKEAKASTPPPKRAGFMMLATGGQDEPKAHSTVPLYMTTPKEAEHEDKPGASHAAESSDEGFEPDPVAGMLQGRRVPNHSLIYYSTDAGALKECLYPQIVAACDKLLETTFTRKCICVVHEDLFPPQIKRCVTQCLERYFHVDKVHWVPNSLSVLAADEQDTGLVVEFARHYTSTVAVERNEVLEHTRRVNFRRSFHAVLRLKPEQNRASMAEYTAAVDPTRVVAEGESWDKLEALFNDTFWWDDSATVAAMARETVGFCAVTARAAVCASVKVCGVGATAGNIVGRTLREVQQVAGEFVCYTI